MVSMLRQHKFLSDMVQELEKPEGVTKVRFCPRDSEANSWQFFKMKFRIIEQFVNMWFMFIEQFINM